MKKAILFIIAVFTFVFIACEQDYIEADDNFNLWNGIVAQYNKQAGWPWPINDLTIEKEEEILHVYYDEYGNSNEWMFWDYDKEEYLAVTKDDLFIVKYYGSYNGYVVVSVSVRDNALYPDNNYCNYSAIGKNSPFFS